MKYISPPFCLFCMLVAVVCSIYIVRNKQTDFNTRINNEWSAISRQRVKDMKQIVPDNKFLPIKKTILETNKGVEGSGSISGGYFLFVGSIHGSQESHLAIQQEVYFAWLGPTGYYNNSHISLDQVKVMTGSYDTPNIRFVYKDSFIQATEDVKTLVDIESCRRQGGTYYGTPGDVFSPETCRRYYTLHDSSEQDIISNHIAFIIIQCKENDWKPEFNLNYNK